MERATDMPGASTAANARRATLPVMLAVKMMIMAQPPSMLHREAYREDRADDDDWCRQGQERHRNLAGDVTDHVAGTRPHPRPCERARDCDSTVASRPHVRRPRHAGGDRVQLGNESAAEQKSKLMIAEAPLGVVDILCRPL